MVADDPISDTLARARAGDERAIEALYRRHHPMLLRYLGARVGPAAEDVASQVWLEVARGLARFVGDDAAFRAFLFTVARRRAANERRRRARDRSSPAGDVPDRASTGPGPEETVLDGLDGEAAAALVARLLPAAQADVVLLRVLGGLDVDQVAAVLGRRPGTVRVLQHRALRRLAGHFRSDL